MGANELLLKMLRYQAWANDETFEAMKGFDAERHAEERQSALRLMNHCLVVNKIFAAHLVGDRHGFAADNTSEMPELDELRIEVETLDRWYLDYVKTATQAVLSQSVPFTFTDGDNGYMTREEMLTHVITHGGYHRGEVGRLMTLAVSRSGQGMKLPWDTYAVHLHRTEPVRRLQGKAESAEAATHWRHS
ncbi:DinB family protein [Paraburkholderia caledonica]|uniref:Damage-inducible protein DinB n=1 Tax=Paraburkholderia caledonica TaxID=134536 RepID=A0AB73IL71_9BURK|nr:putative damage-inducible protein DinB [Paraburkholderia caledonica]